MTNQELVAIAHDMRDDKLRPRTQLLIVAGVWLFALLPWPIIALAQSQSTTSTRSFYDHSGSFAGSSATLNNNTTSFSDKGGKFSGSAIHNSDGTSSFYDRNGHFTGSSVNTTAPRR